MMTTFIQKRKKMNDAGVSVCLLLATALGVSKERQNKNG